MSKQIIVLKKVLFNLFVFFSIVILLDQIIGRGLRWLYFQQKQGYNYKTIYTLDEVKSPVLIIGSSRANYNFYPQTFEDSLKLDSYNAGLKGHYIFYYYAVLKCVIKRYSPQIIILDVIPTELNKRAENYDCLSTLLPEYSNHPELKQFLLLKSKYENLKMVSAIYPFNSLILSSLKAVLSSKNEIAMERKLKGFDPTLIGRVYGNYEKQVYKNNIDTNAYNTLQSFLNDCKFSKTKLFITISPMYTTYNKQCMSISLIKKIAAKYSVNLWDYSQNEYFLKHPELFHDTEHLNNSGAKIFSKIIAGRIKSTLKN